MEKLDEALGWIKAKAGLSGSKEGAATTSSKEKDRRSKSSNISGDKKGDALKNRLDLTTLQQQKSGDADATANTGALANDPDALAANEAAKAAGRQEMVIPDGMNLVDDAYELKMAAFETDCNDGFGFGTACHHVAEFYSVVKDEHDRAKATFEKNCHRENNPYYASCFNLGKLYLSGRGSIEQSDDLAASNFKRACDNGHLQACYHEGVLKYLLNDGSGKGEVKDEKEQSEGIKVLEKACGEGELDSCYFAGTHYINKETSGTYRSPAKGAALMKIACDSNHAPSCFNLAVMYKHGDTGIKPDQAQYEAYRIKTQALVGETGSLKGTKTA